MITLAIDTCLGACSAAVLDGERVRASLSEPMWRGHQERLAPLVAQVMVEAGAAFTDLDLVAATVGPGSFTGLRVGVAFAKGLALALDIPSAGVGTLEAFAQGQAGPALVLADARRGQVYWQAFDGGRALTEPAVSALEEVSLHVEEGSLAILGPAASFLATAFPQARILQTDAPDPAAIARLAAGRGPAPLSPLYLRAPDAKLPGGIDP